MTNITVNDFQTFIQCVGERLTDEGVYNVNHGGCGFFAAELAKRMIDIGMNGVGIRVYGDGSDDGLSIDGVREEMERYSVDTNDVHNWNDNGVDFAHIVVEWDGCWWDCEGQVMDACWHRWGIFEGYLDIEDCEAISSDSEGWNPTYDRINDDTIQEVLDECIELLV